jgi:hypothetical protein
MLMMVSSNNERMKTSKSSSSVRRIVNYRCFHHWSVRRSRNLKIIHRGF